MGAVERANRGVGRRCLRGLLENSVGGIHGLPDDAHAFRAEAFDWLLIRSTIRAL